MINPIQRQTTKPRDLISERLYKSRSRSKGIREHDLTWEYLHDLLMKQKGICALTGLQMTLETGRGNVISLDRIDSTKGYIPGNVQWVCDWANTMKSDHPMPELINKMKIFIAYQSRFKNTLPNYPTTYTSRYAIGSEAAVRRIPGICRACIGQSETYVDLSTRN